ncbi:MAG: N-6 DNA methylase [Nitrososphaerota archaeon]
MLVRIDKAKKAEIVWELKIGKGEQKFATGVAQAYQYAQELGADGIVTVMYPEEVRRPVISQEDVRSLALKTKLKAIILTPFLTDYFERISIRDLVNRIQEAWNEYKRKKTPAISPNLVIATLRDCVRAISLELRQGKGITDPLVETVVGSFDLFRILATGEGAGAEAENETQRFRLAALDLAAYILVNQLLLYRLLEQPLHLPKIEQLRESPRELVRFFAKVTDINYEPIYSVDVASQLPVTREMLKEVNIAISALRAIQPERLSHDLLGRIFHEFLPFKTRKLLGAFYTKPQAAEILAGLAIELPEEIVFDPACGSGTLLVAAYRRKRSLLHSCKKAKEKDLRQDLFGVDIMPFAAHLAAVNLILQDVLATVSHLNIGVGNSLILQPSSKVSTIGSQLNMFPSVGLVDPNKVRLKDEVFSLPKRVDVIIMNPPFTRKERLSEGMKGDFSGTFAQSQNYWAYFLALADRFLGDGGKIAAVLPRDFVIGDYSQEVRSWLFANGTYSLRFIVRTMHEIAFSEAARFRDFLVVMSKGKNDDPCAVVYLKRKLSDLSIDDAEKLANSIKRILQEYGFEDEYEDDNVVISLVPQSKIRENHYNLWPLVGFSHPRIARIVCGFLQKVIERAETVLTPMRDVVTRIIRGIEPKKEGLLNAVFVVRPLNPKRVERSQIIFEKEDDKGIVARFSKGELSRRVSIPYYAVKSGLKTAVYLQTLDVTQNCDWFIFRRFEGFKDIEKLAKVKVDFEELSNQADKRQTHLVVARRIDLAGPGTMLLAFYSQINLVPSKAFWSLYNDSDTSKALCLWLNSVVFIVQVLMGRTETRGSWCELTEGLLEQALVPKADFIAANKAKFEETFEKLRSVKWPSLLEQFENQFDPRLEIDCFVLSLLGFSRDEINALLPDVYEAIAKELHTLKEAMKPHQSQFIDETASLFD